MKTFNVLATIVAIGAASASSEALAALIPGDVAPAFSAETAEGKLVSLSDFKGKTVVLEWANYGCPFVRKHYDSKNMQKLQETYGAGKDESVVWLTVFSSAPGKQGYLKVDELAAAAKDFGGHSDHLLRDPTGVIGEAYGAKTTPHMYVVNAEGNIAYQGAIDSKSGVDSEEIKDADNYVVAALTAISKGEEPDPNETTPYGCSVKYNSGY